MNLHTEQKRYPDTIKYYCVTHKGKIYPDSVKYYCELHTKEKRYPDSVQYYCELQNTVGQSHSFEFT